MLLTASDLLSAGDASARALTRLGVGQGERVALCAAPSPQLLAAVVGLWRVEAVAVGLPTRHPPATLAEMLRRTGTRRLLFDAPPPEPLTGGPADALPPYRPRAQSGLRLSDLDAERPATLVFTSGSTGTPKAAQHTLGAHLASARGSHANLPFEPGDAWLLSLPLYHVGGLSILARTLVAGAALVLPGPGVSAVDALRASGVTHASLVPTQLGRLLRTGADAPSGLKGLLIGGAPAPADLLDRAYAAGLPVRTTYGLTEMASQVTTSDPAGGREALRTSGRVLPGRALRLSSGGEILVRGATRMDGYAGPDGIERPFDADGWYATGDLGRLDADEQLVVTGRRDFQFVSGGENVQPEAIERALDRLPGVRRSVVVGVADAEFGRRPVALLDAPELDLHDARTLEAVRERLSGTLARFLHPVALLPLPADTGLKPDRRSLARLAEKQLAGG